MQRLRPECITKKAGETRLFSCALHGAVCVFNEVSMDFIHA